LLFPFPGRGVFKEAVGSVMAPVGIITGVCIMSGGTGDATGVCIMSGGEGGATLDDADVRTDWTMVCAWAASTVEMTSALQ